MITYEMTSDPKLKIGSEYAYRSRCVRDVIRKITLKEYKDGYLCPYIDHHNDEWSIYGLIIPVNSNLLLRSNNDSTKLIKDILCDKIPRLLPTYYYDISRPNPSR
jgi:hypothetical protein